MKNVSIVFHNLRKGFLTFVLVYIVTIHQGCLSVDHQKLFSDAQTYDSLALIEVSDTNYSRAIDYYRKSLALYTEIKQNNKLADCFENIAIILKEINSFDSSLYYHIKALDTRRLIGDSEGVARSYNNIGEVYQLKNCYAISNKFLDSSIAVLKKLSDSVNIVNPLTTKGLNSSFLGQYEEALKSHQFVYRKALDIGDSALIVATVMNLGYDFFNLQQFDNAITYYRKALLISSSIGDNEYKGITYGLYAWALNEKGIFKQALEYADSALGLSDLKIDSGASYYNKGSIYLKMGKPIEAIKHFNQAVYLFKQIPAREREGMVYYKLMLTYKQLNNPQVAILYGKQSVNILQEIRSSIKELSKDVQKGYLQSKGDVYRELADILIGENRLSEAKQVIDMLKQEEYFDYVRGDNNYTSSLNEKIHYLEAEKNNIVALSDIMDSLSKYSIEITRLRQKQNLLSDYEKERYIQLNDYIAIANKQFNKCLDSIKVEYLKSPEKYKKYLDLERSDEIVRILRQLGPKSVLVYTLLEKTKYNIILFTSEIKKWRSFKIESNDLSKDLIKYSELLRDPNSECKLMGKKIYDKIFRPIENDLKTLKVKEILWSLDGALRYIPISALYDGKKYIVEKYRTIIVDPFKLYRLIQSQKYDWSVLGFGVSQQHSNFRALPYVFDELNGIIHDDEILGNHGFLPGVIRMDEKFTRESFLTSLRKPLPIVHIASHFVLNSGDYSSSFLLLGDGSQISIKDLENESVIFSDVKLLTLSACNTAAVANSDGEEVEGFATHALNKGAEVVLASLWPVNDESTAKLMKNFYFIKSNSEIPSIAHALDSAQVLLLHGRSFSENVYASRGLMIKRGKDFKDNPLKADTLLSESVKYNHPHYWAPFVLIGNGK